jgi:hypothetical protein
MGAYVGRVLDASDYRHVEGGYRRAFAKPYAGSSLGTASAKQVSFIRSLLNERNVTPEMRGRCERELTGREASAIITTLLAFPKTAAAQSQPHARAAEVTVTEIGLYEYEDGKVAEVVKARSTGRLYAKAVNLETGDLDYLPGLIFRLAPEQRITLARAQELGTISGRCLRCRRRLDDPKSVSAGIGPICKQYPGWSAA